MRHGGEDPGRTPVALPWPGSATRRPIQHAEQGELIDVSSAAAVRPRAARAVHACPRLTRGHTKSQYFLALGDSYTVGYQDSLKHTTHNGPAGQLVPLARKRGYRYKLVNLGCGGATGSMLKQLGCPTPLGSPGAADFPGKSQVTAAVAFIKAHPGKVGLVTISISGNDVTPCIPQADPITCTTNTMKTVRANLGQTVRRLRAAGGESMRIVGSPYPDVVLGV